MSKNRNTDCALHNLSTQRADFDTVHLRLFSLRLMEGSSVYLVLYVITYINTGVVLRQRVIAVPWLVSFWYHYQIFLQRGLKCWIGCQRVQRVSAPVQCHIMTRWETRPCCFPAASHTWARPHNDSSRITSSCSIQLLKHTPSRLHLHVHDFMVNRWLLPSHIFEIS